MDPAEAERLKQALSTQGILMEQQDATLAKVLGSLQQLTSRVNRLNSGFEATVAQQSLGFLSAAIPPPAVPLPSVPQTAHHINLTSRLFPLLDILQDILAT